MRLSYLSPLLLCLIALVFVPQAEAFGAGNIASIAKIEGHNWRHGDIEDTLKGLAHLRGYKWSGANIKRVCKFCRFHHFFSGYYLHIQLNLTPLKTSEIG
jgi:hypothetical protein